VSHHPHGPGLEREPLARPFLDGFGLLPATPVDPEPTLDSWPSNDVRPYLMTGGRTLVTDAAVAMGTVVMISRRARNGPVPRQAFERARILSECHRPSSVAEVATRLRLPLGVVVVLVTDLIADGLLEGTGARWETALDVGFLERLIAGVSAL
jgi:hypothetical protein